MLLQLTKSRKRHSWCFGGSHWCGWWYRFLCPLGLASILSGTEKCPQREWIRRRVCWYLWYQRDIRPPYRTILSALWRMSQRRKSSGFLDVFSVRSSLQQPTGNPIRSFKCPCLSEMMGLRSGWKLIQQNEPLPCANPVWYLLHWPTAWFTPSFYYRKPQSGIMKRRCIMFWHMNLCISSDLTL